MLIKEKRIMAMSHETVFLRERLHCGCLMKVSQDLQWLEHQHEFESWDCDMVRCAERVHQTNNFGLQMELIQPYCLKANQEKNRENALGMLCLI